jgi:uncharacterized membrane protein
LTEQEEREERVTLGLAALRNALYQSLAHTILLETQSFTMMVVSLGFFLGSLFGVPFLSEVLSLVSCIIWACAAGWAGSAYHGCKKRKQNTRRALQMLNEWAEREKKPS